MGQMIALRRVQCEPHQLRPAGSALPLKGGWYSRQDQGAASAKFWEVWDKVPFGFTPWTHRPLGFMVLALAYRSGVPWNESAYSNAKFDELLTKAEGTLDVDVRREIIGELEKGFQIHPTLYIFGLAVKT